MGSRKAQQGRGGKRRKVLGSLVAAACFETATLWLRSGRFGGEVVVRCRAGHLFTTLWIPAVSVKALRLGFVRVQHCPVGHHWTVVTPVREHSLSDEDRDAARAIHDLRIP